jgi:hypothetical protein
MIVTAMGVVPAAAQRAAGPFSGLLGAATDADARQTLEVRGSLFGAWDDNLTRTGDPALDDRFLRSGGAAGVSGSLTHARRSSRFQWSSSIASSTRLYGTGSDDRAATFNAQTGFSTELSRRVALSATGDLAYSPYYDFAAATDTRLSHVGAFGGGFNVATAAERNVSGGVGTGVTVQLTRRDSIAFNGRATRNNFLDQRASAIESWSAGARWGRTLTRNIGVHAGYARLVVTYYNEGSAPFTGYNF